MARHFLNILDIPQADIFKVLERAKALKDGDVRTRLLDGKTVILIFEKASTRTRVSFEVAVRHLGGSTVFLTPHESQLGRNEPLKDTARVLARNADYLNTDVWASMGQEAEQLRREAAFEGYQLNDALMALAKPGCKVMHCLPAHRGEEISDEVFEANADMIFDEAENRLHMQKAILEWVFEAL